MANNVIIHIPHASLDYPKFFSLKILINKNEFDKENIFISDYLVDLFAPVNYSNIVKFEFSRLFCDVERFRDDNIESMSKKGMGAIYECDSNGNKFINYNNDYKNYVLDNYYDVHHKKLDDLTTKILKNNDYCLIIDLHSFSDEFVFKVLGLNNNPDICIGYEDDFKDIEIIDKTISHFKKYGYSVKCNYPYIGSLVPNRYWNRRDNKVKSIMIEINKRIYLNNNVQIEQEKFQKLKRCMDDYYKNVIGLE